MTEAVRPAPTKAPKNYQPGSQVKPPHLCIFGAGGTGKTTILHTMPGKGAVIETPQQEGGGSWVLEPWKDRIDVFPVESWDDIDEVYWWLRANKSDYKWAAIDTITGMEKLSRRKVIKERSLDADPHITAPQEWGKMGLLQEELFYRMQTLAFPFIWLAQEKGFRGELADGTEFSKLGPAIIPSALGALFPQMMLVARLYMDVNLESEWERRLRFGPPSAYVCKVRHKPGIEVPWTIKNPDLHKTVRYLLGREGGHIEPVDDVLSLDIAQSGNGHAAA